MTRNITLFSRLKRCQLYCYLYYSRLKLQMFKSFANFVQNSLLPTLRIKKVAFVVLIVLALLFYSLSRFLGRHWTIQPPSLSGLHDRCIEREVRYLDELSGQFDATYSHVPSHKGETSYPAYVGNGHLAAALGSDNGLYIRTGQSLGLAVPFYPVITLLQSGLDLKVVQGVSIVDGFAQRTEAIRWESGCVMVTHHLYAHRSRPTLLVQDIHIHNPTNKRLTFSLHQTAVSGWSGAQTDTVSIKDKFGQQVSYYVTSGIVPDEGKTVVAVVTATRKVVEVISIDTEAKKLFHILTAVRYSNPFDKKVATGKIAGLTASVMQDIKTASGLDATKLMNEHTEIWNKMWQSGFSISLSKAHGALNGDRINSTLYHILSNVHAPQHETATSAGVKARINRSLYFPDRCYEGSPPTLQAATLWSATSNEAEIAALVTRWLITLEKHGCQSMVDAGAEGVLQASILSLSGLKFRNQHLEFGVPPKDLHRDLHLRRINYGNNTHVNVSVEVGDDNKAVLYVALDRSDRPYYACDAGCIDAPVLLGKERRLLPVKLTEPITPILYITADLEHMTQLKNVIHVKEIHEAPAHEHHVIALHRHGHHFGGLPTIFWVSIAFLILVFHLFLFKLIYNEYCAVQDRFTRGKYSL